MFVSVFLGTFLIFVCTRPEFLHAKPESPLEVSKFSPSKAAIGALVVACTSAGILVATRMGRKWCNE